MDLDIKISAWSNMLLYSFDAIFTRELYIAFGEAMFNNDIFLAKKEHPMLLRYLQIFKSQFEEESITGFKHIQNARCI